MVQGNYKPKTTSSEKVKYKRPTGITKLGKRTIPPKKAALVKSATIMKKNTSGLTGKTEKALGAKAGHLELLKGGKKNKDTNPDVKGGSKKFG